MRWPCSLPQTPSCSCTDSQIASPQLTCKVSVLLGYLCLVLAQLLPERGDQRSQFLHVGQRYGCRSWQACLLTWAMAVWSLRSD